jgi:hypothetical protein
MPRNSLFAAIALLALGACATQETQTAGGPPEGRDCFPNNAITGYNIIDEHNVSVRASGRTYIFTTNWNARDLDWSEQIAIRSTTNWICTGNGLGVDVIGGQPPRTYPIASIARAPETPQPSGS